MTTDAKIPVANAPQQSEEDPTQQKLLDRQMTAFRESVAQEGLEGAFRRYGFTMFHCLPDEERILIEEQMGLTRKDASGAYNLGLAYAAKDDLETAISFWKQALKKDPDLVEAEFNLAVAYERQGNKTQARKQYERYLKMASDPEEIQVIQSHLSELE
jgi:tetratricopeptide (TPR) repeat protein